VSEKFSEPEEIKEYFNKLGMGDDIIQVYIALLRYGKTGVGNLSRSTSIDRAKIYRTLKLLQELKLVEVVGGNPMKFEALRFNDAIETLLQTKEEQLNQLKVQKDSILKKYGDRFKAPENAGTNALRLRISEGIDPVITTINSVVQKSSNNINFLLDKRNLIRIYSKHTIVYMARKVLEGVRIRLLLPRDESVVEVIKDIAQKFEVRTTDISEPLSYITCDGYSVIMLLESAENNGAGSSSSRVSGIEVDGTDSAKKMNSLFEYIWERSENFGV